MIRNTACKAALVAALAVSAHAATTITYEDANLGSQGYINNTPYTAAGVTHSNSYNSTWGSWSGFAISNHANTSTPGYANQYSSFAGGGAGGSAQFAVGYESAKLNLPGATDLTGMGAQFTNTTYTALSMLDGDSFAKKFGGTTGNDPDYLLLTITGYFNNASTGTTSLYLADYRFTDNSQDYVLDTWESVDFSPLGTVDEIRFTLSSTDNGSWGMNTPSYFAMDNLVVPEPSAWSLSLLGGLGLLRRNRKECPRR